jgi:hypothetical protein
VGECNQRQCIKNRHSNSSSKTDSWPGCEEPQSGAVELLSQHRGEVVKDGGRRNLMWLTRGQYIYIYQYIMMMQNRIEYMKAAIDSAVICHRHCFPQKICSIKFLVGNQLYEVIWLHPRWVFTSSSGLLEQLAACLTPGSPASMEASELWGPT